MSINLNRVKMTGYLAQELELIDLPAGQQACEPRIACNRRSQHQLTADGRSGRTSSTHESSARSPQSPSSACRQDTQSRSTAASPRNAPRATTPTTAGTR